LIIRYFVCERGLWRARPVEPTCAYRVKSQLNYSGATLGAYSLLKSLLPLLPSVQILFYSFCDFSRDGLMFMGVDPAGLAFKCWTRRVFFSRKTKGQQALANQRNVDSSPIHYAFRL
jgi:hypothetical protein